MTQHFFIGVDGGATKCIVRVEDAKGRLLGREVRGPANIRLSVDQAWKSILDALKPILSAHQLSLDDVHCQFHTGMGLAGTEIKSALQAFQSYPHPFTSLWVASDAHTACVGAHQGKDGAIIVAGTGVIGYQTQAGQASRVGGWGFPHDDEGGGAWLGWQAVRYVLQWLDGRLPVSALAKKIYARFDHDLEKLVNWSNEANSTAYAELAPIVIQQSQAADPVAVSLMQQAAAHIDRVAIALESAQPNRSQPLPCVLMGGVAKFLEPYVSETLQNRLQAPACPPDEGALIMVRTNVTKKGCE